jgi:hypothetical protein
LFCIYEPHSRDINTNVKKTQAENLLSSIYTFNEDHAMS